MKIIKSTNNQKTIFDIQWADMGKLPFTPYQFQILMGLFMVLNLYLLRWASENWRMKLGQTYALTTAYLIVTFLFPGWIFNFGLLVSTAVSLAVSVRLEDWPGTKVSTILIMECLIYSIPL